MPLKRISHQKNKLEEDFHELMEEEDHFLELMEGENISPANSGHFMLQFIKRFNELFPTETIWCLTSHRSLVLLSEDNWRSNRNVIISCLHSREIYIEYLMPEKLRPWERATVKGTAGSLDAAIEYTLIAMRNSEGWGNTR
jgi:hypothetical protein